MLVFRKKNNGRYGKRTQNLRDVHCFANCAKCQRLRYRAFMFMDSLGVATRRPGCHLSESEEHCNPVSVICSFPAMVLLVTSCDEEYFHQI